MYRLRIDEMLDETVRCTFDDLEAKSQIYINQPDYWIRMGTAAGLGSRGVDLANLTLSTSGSILFVSLRDWLFNYSKSFHPKLFARLWQMIANRLDDLLYNRVSLGNTF